MSAFRRKADKSKTGRDVCLTQSRHWRWIFVVTHNAALGRLFLNGQTLQRSSGDLGYVYLLY
jgi:hypothetical protein